MVLFHLGFLSFNIPELFKNILHLLLSPTWQEERIKISHPQVSLKDNKDVKNRQWDKTASDPVTLVAQAGYTWHSEANMQYGKPF